MNLKYIMARNFIGYPNCE